MNWYIITKQPTNIYKKLNNTNVEFYHFWLNNILFTWRWWFVLFQTVLPWILWILFRKKESTDRLLYAGFFVMILSSALDIIGIAMNLWYYPVKLSPLISESLAYNISVLPIVMMFAIQCFPEINPFVKAVILAALDAAIFQPLNQWIGLYTPVYWKHYYSIPIIILIYLFANYISSRNKFTTLK